MDNQKKTPYGTAVLKAISILEYLSEKEEAQGVSEIARGTGLNKPTVFKLLETLTLVGWVEKEEREARFRPGLSLIRLAQRSLDQMNVVKLTEPELKQLNEETGETVHLGLLDKWQVVYVNKLECKQTVRMYSQIGRTAPLYCTGIGKALLSCLTEEELGQFFAETELKPFTPQTITRREELLQNLEEIRSKGYAVDKGEHEEEVRCMAIPLQHQNKVYGAVSVSAPRYRTDDERLLRFFTPLENCRRRILERLSAAI
ncbi:IclR family transcriptional regulator [Paludifilum halophilum]|uniref:IclR family transcriptional regulator n=1 Tax=Paludifilum halophilum TaxID=1642702 RepID=A0A235B516_9BACL|nr:IclR family transcriptional regulator [Paludifilum halophilum]OYD06705.1 hypothetical protein CHM34_14075 [Paludifilum halophilum]